MSDRNLHSDTAAGIDNLQLQFPGQEQPLFNGLSLEINRGEKVLLLGPSGSGKSTLLKVLTGLIPDTIEVPVRWTCRQPFRSWGYVFQDPDAQFCMPYVDEEIAFVLENRAMPQSRMSAEIDYYLRMVGLDFEDVHRPIETLSQGQKQRLALASALALEPDTLVLDEPTALLDPGGTEAIWQQVRQLGDDKTLLVVEHKIARIIDYMDRVLVLDDGGKLILDTTPEDIRTRHRTLLNDYGIWHAQSWSNYDQVAKKRTCEVAGKDRVPALLEIESVKGYRDEKLCISLPRLKIRPGEWIAITGPNGAGKSTLLMALMRLIKTEGQWFFKDELVKETEQMASEIGFVFQNPELQFVAQNVREEIAFTLERHHADWQEETINQRVAETLDRYELSALADQNPYTLSTGQQRRLSVAATTVQSRALLLLDEPTFGQDAANTFAILERLEACRRQGTALLMVTHNPQIVQRFATRVWRIEEGRLASDRAGKRVSRMQTTEAKHVV